MNTDNLNTIWNEFLNKIEKELIPISFDVWFKDTKLVELKDDTAKVLVQSDVFKKELQRNFNTLIEDIFTQVTGSNFKFEYVTEDEFNNNISVNPDETIGVPKDALFETNLIDKYTFDNFVTGSSNTDKNRFAKAIALSVAENPGQMYNPLYIYGSSGLGKTHLMHAIGNYITANSGKKVLYVTSEKFVDDFMQLYKKKNNEETFNDDLIKFKKKYRDLDVLIIDDIQYLEVVGGIQQEFFNTFQELHDNNKQIILASDRSPDDLKKLEERIRTRFTWGILVNIYPPDFDVRMDIIDKKLENNDLSFPKEVKEYIASNCTSDVRRLEGAIRRILAYATMMNGSDITLELAEEALKDILPSSIITKNKIDLLQQIICSTYNISIEDLKGKKRNSEIAVPRQIAMFIARKYINESFPKIGSDFGGKDHTTVMHSVNKIENEIKTNKDLQNQIMKIVEKINV